MYKVVIVEDSLIVRQGLIQTTDWRRMDCEVVGEAANGEDGIAVILKEKPDIVIADIRMPGLSGIDMIESVAQHHAAKYIIISAYSDFEYAKRAIQLGVVDYLVKPVDDEQLERAIRKAQSGQKEPEGFQPLSEKGRDYVSLAVRYMHEHFASPIRVRDIADQININESYLSHIFHVKTSWRIMDYLTAYRIDRAKRLLLDTQMSVTEVAQSVGYSDQHYFSNVFRKTAGMTPSEWRERK